MSTDQDISTLVKGIIETQVIQALNSAPEAIEKLVKAALSKPVDESTGRSEGYSSNKVPYLDWLVGEEIRSAARSATAKIIKEQTTMIEAEIRKGLSSDSVAAAVTNAFVRAAEHDWAISVSFERGRK